MDEDAFVQLTAELYFMEAQFQSLSADFIDSVLIANRDLLYARYGTTDSIYHLSKCILHKNLACAFRMEKRIEEAIKSYQQAQ